MEMLTDFQRKTTLGLKLSGSMSCGEMPTDSKPMGIST
jgi:hypothetical protein